MEFPSPKTVYCTAWSNDLCTRKSVEASSSHWQNHLALSGGVPSVYVLIINTHIWLLLTCKKHEIKQLRKLCYNGHASVFSGLFSDQRGEGVSFLQELKSNNQRFGSGGGEGGSIWHTNRNWQALWFLGWGNIINLTFLSRLVLIKDQSTLVMERPN